MIYDVVIIGAGMSGLAAGIRLAYFDKKVCILEKHSRIGGLNSYYTKGGYELDVGLHAVTNYAKRGDKKKPLNRLLRQLRIGYDEFDLYQQIRSAIKFDDTTIYFTNDFQMLESQIAEKFPFEINGFQKLVKYIKDYNELDLNARSQLTKAVLKSFISDPLLTDMLLCPMMFYGNPKEDDMEFWMFVVMFKSIFLEGLARPSVGVRRFLNVLKNKFVECGGKLYLKKGVKKIVPDKKGGLHLELETGETFKAKKVISSAGYVETMRLCEGDYASEKIKPGKMSFIESVYILNKKPSELGIDDSIIFYNSGERFNYQKPDTLIDEKSGVICCPNNFAFDAPLNENMIRITNIANSDLWDKYDDDEYVRKKDECMQLSLDEAGRYVKDFKDNIIFKDSFTPKTIKKYTSHINGAVYGTGEKLRDGLTGIKNLFICGTDQGFLGIIGAMLSGITIANLHALK
jgi:phytoene dehydrogenase-like protein